MNSSYLRQSSLTIVSVSLPIRLSSGKILAGFTFLADLEFTVLSVLVETPMTFEKGLFVVHCSMVEHFVHP